MEGVTGVATQRNFLSRNTTSLWRRIFAVSPHTFIEKVLDPEERHERVLIEVSAHQWDDDLRYRIEYRAYRGARVAMKAREEVTSSEIQQALRVSEGGSPGEIASAVHAQIQQMVQDTHDRIEEAKIPVEVRYF